MNLFTAILEGLCQRIQDTNFEEHFLIIVMKLSCLFMTCNFVTSIMDVEYFH